MKRIILMSVFALVAVFFSENLFAGPKVVVKGTVEIARPKKDCKKGIWFCHPTIEVDVEAFGRMINTNFTDNGDGTMTIEFLNKLPESGSFFYADKNEIVVLPSEMCRKFGYSSITLLPDSYRILAPSSGNFGSVVVKFEAN